MNLVPNLAVDQALPQRDLLLDENVMSEYLARLLARYGNSGIEECERLRTKYRVGTSLRVLYECRGSERSYRIAARAFPRTQRIADRVAPTIGIQTPELNTIFWVFPHDRKIENLSALVSIPEELRKIGGQQWIASRIVGHAPEKTVTAQCVGADGEILAYAKIYAGDEGQQIFNTYNEVNAALKGDLRIPRALAYSAAHHLLLLESVSGVSLSAIAPAERENSFRLLGQALKTFHRINPPASIARCTRFSPEKLTRTAATIIRVRPDAASQVQRLTQQLIAQYRVYKEALLLHGDLHPKNILLDRERVVLLDLDQAAIGNAAADLGSVIAGLYCNSCTGSIAWREAFLLKRAFLSGYGPYQTHSLRWHIAAALLQERALRSVTRIRVDSLEKLPEILATAHAVLNGGLGEN